MRVLFVDDDAHVLESLRRQARGSGLVAHFASSGADALTLVAKEQLDVVVSDMRMPGMDGAELLAQVAALRPSIRRIILSGEASVELRERAMPIAHAWLSKPCTFSEIREAIANLHRRT